MCAKELCPDWRDRALAILHLSNAIAIRMGNRTHALKADNGMARNGIGWLQLPQFS